MRTGLRSRRLSGTVTESGNVYWTFIESLNLENVRSPGGWRGPSLWYWNMIPSTSRWGSTGIVSEPVLTLVQTLLYMVIQKADSDCSGALPPPGIRAPVWVELVKQWDAVPAPVQKSVELGPEMIALGRDDSELDDHTTDNAKSHEFGWDNENPRREVEVGRFKVDFRPITVKEFFGFWAGNTDEGASRDLPASWVVEGGEIKVCLAPPSYLTRRKK